MSKKKELNGLRGWLILVGLGVIISPVRLLATYYPIYSQILTDGTWEILTTPGSEVYHPLWAPLLMGEIIFNSALVLISICLIYLFFSKHHLFPRVYIAVILVSLVFIPLDAWLATFVMPDQPMFDPETLTELMRSILAGVIWVPYMLVSKRVKATFIKEKST